MTKPPNAWRGSREWPVSPAAYPLNPSKPKGETYTPDPDGPPPGGLGMILWMLGWFATGLGAGLLILFAIWTATNL